MNISTYESRIKALEDQLNPPAPPADPRTGIQSIVITPDVGGSNARLAAMMPIAPVAYDPKADPIIFRNENQEVDPETEYIITVTPGTDYYAMDPNTVGSASETAGAPINIRVSGNNYIDVAAMAMDVDPSGTTPPTMWSKIQLLIGHIL